MHGTISVRVLSGHVRVSIARQSRMLPLVNGVTTYVGTVERPANEGCVVRHTGVGTKHGFNGEIGSANELPRCDQRVARIKANL